MDKKTFQELTLTFGINSKNELKCLGHYLRKDLIEAWCEKSNISKRKLFQICKDRYNCTLEKDGKDYKILFKNGV